MSQTTFAIMRITLMLAMIAAFTLPGCEYTKQEQAESQVEKQWQNTDFGYVYDFKLEDGTRCIFAESVNRGGVSCDWKSNDGQ
jgi:outer membrane biogenesis lipoprotein LolB